MNWLFSFSNAAVISSIAVLHFSSMALIYSCFFFSVSWQRASAFLKYSFFVFSCLSLSVCMFFLWVASMMLFCSLCYCSRLLIGFSSTSAFSSLSLSLGRNSKVPDTSKFSFSLVYVALLEMSVPGALLLPVMFYRSVGSSWQLGHLLSLKHSGHSL